MRISGSDIGEGDHSLNRIYIWGAGVCAEHVYAMINQERCIVQGIVDQDKNKQGKLWNDTLRIGPPEDLCSLQFDYVVFSMMKYDHAVSMCRRMGVPEDRMVIYWRPYNGAGIFKDKEQELLEEQKKRKIYENRLESAPYEWGIREVPVIGSSEKLLKKIKEERGSLCRFGDGEFEMMRGRVRPWFQMPDDTLKERLLEVLHTKDPAINLAIAQNYTGFERYTENAADGIREYMSKGTRDAIFEFLDQKRLYYDAYVTRPYIIYRDKTNAEMLFPLWKAIWEGHPVIIVEGKYGRTGIHNDLFEGAKHIRRIICPDRNAWSAYKEIKNAVGSAADKEDLICISLGPAATILAYDLAKMGFQAIDIGQLDNEYDWYRMGVQSKVPIAGKMVAEVCNNEHLDTFADDKYFSQIISVIDKGGSL